MTERLHQGAFTGCLDMYGSEIHEGHCIRHNNAHDGIKPEYHLPVYLVIFNPPSFTLKHVGGGKPSGSYDFILRYGGKNRCIEIVPYPKSLPTIEEQLNEALYLLDHLRGQLILSTKSANRIDALLNGKIDPSN